MNGFGLKPILWQLDGRRSLARSSTRKRGKRKMAKQIVKMIVAIIMMGLGIYLTVNEQYTVGSIWSVGGIILCWLE
jgi:ABC-type protease/lipase transport system fused ATPase/permease subunit